MSPRRTLQDLREESRRYADLLPSGTETPIKKVPFRPADTTLCLEYIRELESGGFVSMLQLRNALGSDNCTIFDNNLYYNKISRQTFKRAQTTLKYYTRQLVIGDLMQTQSERAKDQIKITRLANRSEEIYESALDILRNVINHDPDLVGILHPPLDESKNMSDRDTIPRARTHARPNLEIKLTALRSAVPRSAEATTTSNVRTVSVIARQKGKKRLAQTRTLDDFFE